MNCLQHTVAFRLNDGVDPDWFLEQARTLGELPGVQDFEVLAQISAKSSHFAWALSMWFNSEEEYESYNDHPTHIDFVLNAWLPNVSEFLELDYLRVPA
jgi:hypothetical protein